MNFYFEGDVCYVEGDICYLASDICYFEGDICYVECDICYFANDICYFASDIRYFEGDTCCFRCLCDSMIVSFSGTKEILNPQVKSTHTPLFHGFLRRNDANIAFGPINTMVSEVSLTMIFHECNTDLFTGTTILEHEP